MKSPSSNKNKSTPASQSFFSEKGKGTFFSPYEEATTSFFPPSLIQAKLAIGQAGDKYEQEADAMAEQVVGQSAPTIQAKDDMNEEEEQIQTKANDSSSTGSPQLESQLNSTKGKGQPLEGATRSSMESAFGADFSAVRVHTNADAVQMNQELGAQAFAHGKNVYFDKGKFAPHTTEGKKLLAHELTHTIQQNSLVNRVQLFRVRRVERVPSLAIESYISTNIASTWAHLQNKMRERDRIIRERLTLVNAGSSDHTVLTRLERRWPSFRRALGSSDTDPASWGLPEEDAISDARTSEREDRSALGGRPNRSVRGSIRLFILALNGFLDTRGRLDEEREEFHRFDPLVNAADVITLLNAVQGPHFTRADLKALTGQETGDFTNTRIHGISGTAGIRGQGRRNPGHIGLGQLTPDARDEAITWAASQGVTIPARPDPRRTPVLAFKLAAAYMGRVSEIFQTHLPANIPSGDEYKKLVFAGYNGGPGAVFRAARSFVGGRTDVDYTWLDISTQPTVTGQMRNYVVDIVRRLS